MAMNTPPTFLSSASPSFTSLPPLPNSNNPNPNFFNFNQHNPHPSATITIPPPPLPPPPSSLPDLPAALSTLKHLIHLSQTTLASTFSLLPTSSATPPLSTCPFNPHHRVPPESLFRHSLQCLSSPDHDLLLLLDSLRYPHTLHSSHKQNSFVQTLHDPNADLCFSLDDFSDFGPSFFYRDCPGVVTSAKQESTSRTFTLPGILSVECANFSSSNDNMVSKTVAIVEEHNIRVLPSEFWLLRAEIDAWNEYPSSYSYAVLRAIVCFLTVDECDFRRWVIANSPYYGVVIDVPMRDHIVLLFRLCLKAIVREAVKRAELVFIKDTKLNPGTTCFSCPILVEVMEWLSFQLSVLYGEMNRKRFVVNMLKQWMLNSSLNSSLFPLKKVDASSDLNNMDGKSVETLEKGVIDDGNSSMDKHIHVALIFVSQVAAAVSALHERALLEEKLKALWHANPLTNYQRVSEHAYLSKKADEERRRRFDYRSLLEHDGLVWHRPHDQEGNKTKTREELLAEERDYKRRRMSYRGKKLKRNTTEVMRDIIEEYMNSIRQAGGIGCLIKGSDESEKFSSEPSSHVDFTVVDGRKKNVSNSSVVISDHSRGHKEPFHSQSDTRFTRCSDDTLEDRKQHTRDSSRYHEHRDVRRTIDRDGRSREKYSRSPDRQSHGRGYRDDTELSKKKLPRVSEYSDNWSHGQTNYRRERVNQDLELKSRSRRHSERDDRADSVTSHEFEDRYDPYESRDMYEE